MYGTVSFALLVSLLALAAPPSRVVVFANLRHPWVKAVKEVLSPSRF